MCYISFPFLDEANASANEAQYIYLDEAEEIH